MKNIMKREDRYFFHETGDGSPTLSHAADGEWMHNKVGAFLETQSVYGTALEKALEQSGPQQVLSVGLGLGYVEIMTVCRLLKQKVELKIASFESEDLLKQNLKNWVHGYPIASDFARAYEKIILRTAQHFGQDPVELKNKMNEGLEAGWWRLLGGLSLEVPFKASAIFYDAYSPASSPELWDERFFNEFLGTVAGPSCVFATYASTGSIKRALKSQGFELMQLRGVGKKRERTLAFR